MRYFVHVDNKMKDILILEQRPTDGLDDTTLTAEKQYSINFTAHNKNVLFKLANNGANTYIFFNGVEIIKFKVEDSEIKATPLCLGNGSKDFSVDNMKESGFHGYVYDFRVDCDANAVDDILDIHKYLMKNNGI